VIDFLMKAANLSFADAVEELAGRCGVEVRYEGGRRTKAPGKTCTASSAWRARPTGAAFAPSGRRARFPEGRAT
jgi:DNA primase